MKKFSSAFTMIELVFIIVILGILAGIAIPRLAATRNDAQVAKIRGDVAAIRSGISLKRGEDMLRGKVSYPELEGGNAKVLFENVVQEGIYPSKDKGKTGWLAKAGTDDATAATATYDACVGGTCTTFTYYRKDNKDASGKIVNSGGSFDCPHGESLCQKLAQ